MKEMIRTIAQGLSGVKKAKLADMDQIDKLVEKDNKSRILGEKEMMKSAEAWLERECRHATGK